MIKQMRKPWIGLIFIATNGVAPSPHIIRSINVQLLRNYGKDNDKTKNPVGIKYV